MRADRSDARSALRVRVRGVSGVRRVAVQRRDGRVRPRTELCAVVPNTTTPVSINSINDQSNSQYYVDNSSGASGYNTTMDGLTVPLECRVAVTPGEQVTIRIAVADASDSIYDSAVALIDGGIYSE